jgi:hypothetical protein
MNYNQTRALNGTLGAQVLETAVKRLIVLLMILAGAFYVAWPAYSGYRIKTALDAEDPSSLEARIDFPSVRQSLRPVAEQRAEAALKSALERAGPGAGTLVDSLKADLLPKAVDRALETLVTPQSLIRMHAQGKNLKDAFDGILKDNAQLMGTIGGLLAGGAGTAPGQPGSSKTLDTLRGIAGQLGFGKPATEPAAGTPPPATAAAASSSASGKKPKYGIENVKSFAFEGPLRMHVGIAKNAAASDADLDLSLAFQDGDWKLVGLVPRI